MSKGTAGPKLPILVTEIAFSRAAVAANLSGVSLRDFAETALNVAVEKAERDHKTRQYETVCRDAVDKNNIRPTRHEFDREQQPFVRRPAGVETTQAGRPSSRHHQNGTERRPDQKREAAPERPAATRSAASMARTREEPPFDQVEHRGIRANSTAHPQQQNRT